MQLVAYGAQDIYLTGNPQITFFKVVYRRHTNFAVESIEQTFNGAATAGNKFSCTISRNGDLLHRVYLEVDHDNVASGFNMIDYVEVEIGGQCIDKHYGEWMAIWTDLTHDKDNRQMLNRILPASAATKSYIPLQFWFCRNPGLALPLIALQYHEVKLNVKFTALATAGVITRCCVFCDYIFLDTDERRRFAQVSHEYLIEQLQFSNNLSAGLGAGTTATATQAELRFNHPVKELMWVIENSVTNLTVTADDCLLQLNGHDRFKRRAGSYFTTVQRYQHHSGDGTNNTVGNAPANLHMYSFALKPEEHQPSGTCNFSRIDNAVLNINYKGTATNAHRLRVYAVNYNVLRIMSGMGGLAYSN